MRYPSAYGKMIHTIFISTAYHQVSPFLCPIYAHLCMSHVGGWMFALKPDKARGFAEPLSLAFSLTPDGPSLQIFLKLVKHLRL